MRRVIALSVLGPVCLVLAAGAAQASPSPAPPVSDVQVVIGPDLQRKAQDYGPADVQQLASELKTDVERELRKAGRLGAPGGVRLELKLSDAVPNHPTMAQLGREPSLDYLRSVGKGGATIDGFEVRPDGSRRKVHFDYYEISLYQARGQSTWGDAQNTFDWFARDYAKGRR
jgi:hypothetical protein